MGPFRKNRPKIPRVICGRFNQLKDGRAGQKKGEESCIAEYANLSVLRSCHRIVIHVEPANGRSEIRLMKCALPPRMCVGEDATIRYRKLPKLRRMPFLASNGQHPRRRACFEHLESLLLTLCPLAQECGAQHSCANVKLLGMWSWRAKAPQIAVCGISNSTFLMPKETPASQGPWGLCSTVCATDGEVALRFISRSNFAYRFVMFRLA